MLSFTNSFNSYILPRSDYCIPYLSHYMVHFELLLIIDVRVFVHGGRFDTPILRIINSWQTFG